MKQCIGLTVLCFSVLAPAAAWAGPKDEVAPQLSMEEAIASSFQSVKDLDVASAKVFGTQIHTHEDGMAADAAEERDMAAESAEEKALEDQAMAESATGEKPKKGDDKKAEKGDDKKAEKGDDKETDDDKQEKAEVKKEAAKEAAKAEAEKKAAEKEKKEAAEKVKKEAAEKAAEKAKKAAAEKAEKDAAEKAKKEAAEKAKKEAAEKEAAEKAKAKKARDGALKGMSEDNGAPAQGFKGKIVEHNDKKTQTDDWNREYGSKSDGLQSWDKVCKENHDNAWCKYHLRKSSERSGAAVPTAILAVLLSLASLA